jgi:hypothetical protein
VDRGVYLFWNEWDQSRTVEGATLAGAPGIFYSGRHRLGMGEALKVPLTMVSERV